ncbi:hypothetical protein DICVIV_12173 [Dictyocaulus viviparus]|uniref:Uncharacterized protein n=1 Tax=Dictyocaulus viviparus TaxID=29172 RepID=A0A0D8XB54_DICVI|nr:hypothetical protein DICVIV_12173 [Dictyocaulus viviparus]
MDSTLGPYNYGNHYPLVAIAHIVLIQTCRKLLMVYILPVLYSSRESRCRCGNTVEELLTIQQIQSPLA